MNKIEEIEHFLEMEIEITKDRHDVMAYDGIVVDADTAKQLNQSHIRFCEKILKMIRK